MTAKGTAPFVPEDEVDDVEVDEEVDEVEVDEEVEVKGSEVAEVEVAEVAVDDAVAETEDVELEEVADVECLPDDVELVAVEVAVVVEVDCVPVVPAVPEVPVVECVPVVSPLEVAVVAAGQSDPSHGSGGAKQPPANAVPAVTRAKMRVEFARMSPISGCQNVGAWTTHPTAGQTATC